MAVELIEASESREFTYGASDAAETILFNGRGSSDQNEIFQAVLAIALGQPGGAIWDNLIRSNIKARIYGKSGRSLVTVEYSKGGLGGSAVPVGTTPPSIAAVPGGGGTTDPGASLDAGYSFNFGGTTEKITQSFKVTASGGIGGAAVPDVKKMIGKTDEGLEGTDRISSVFEWSRTVPFPSISMNYLGILERFCGRLKNDNTFYGRAAGEVLLLGASGQNSEGTKYNVTFRFGVRKNITGANPEYIIGDPDAPDAPNDLVVTAAKGWDYIDIKYAPKIIDGKSIQTAVAFYVHQIYKDGDYSELSIGV